MRMRGLKQPDDIHLEVGDKISLLRRIIARYARGKRPYGRAESTTLKHGGHTVFPHHMGIPSRQTIASRTRRSPSAYRLSKEIETNWGLGSSRAPSVPGRRSASRPFCHGHSASPAASALRTYSATVWRKLGIRWSTVPSGAVTTGPLPAVTRLGWYSDRRRRAPWPQGSPSLREDGRQVFDVFQDQVEQHHVGARAATGQGIRRSWRTNSTFGALTLDLAISSIPAEKSSPIRRRAPGRQPGGVLPSAAAALHDGAAGQIRHDAPQHQLVEVSGSVGLLIVRLAPAVVGRGDVVQPTPPRPTPSGSGSDTPP